MENFEKIVAEDGGINPLLMARSVLKAAEKLRDIANDPEAIAVVRGEEVESAPVPKRTVY
jgi:hypothetical protein